MVPATPQIASSTQDIGTAPPWMRKPLAAGPSPYANMGGSMGNVQTDPATGAGMEMGGGRGSLTGFPATGGEGLGGGAGSLNGFPVNGGGSVTGGGMGLGGPGPGMTGISGGDDPYTPVTPTMAPSTASYSSNGPAGAPATPAPVTSMTDNAGNVMTLDPRYAAIRAASGLDPNSFGALPAGGTPGAPGAPGAAPAGAPGGAPVSNTGGIDINGQEAWKGGPKVDQTRVGAGGLPGISTDFSGDAQRGADAAYSGATQFMDKDFTRDNAALESKLVSQGFSPGTEAFDSEMEKQKRGQNATRENAAFAAQGVGFDQSGQLLSRALASRAALRGERTDDADRTFGQSLATANLGLGARGQDTGLAGAREGAAASTANAGAAAGASNYNTDVNAGVAMRRIGLDSSNSDVNNLISLINSSRGGVNMPNFGAPAPLDVGSAASIASGNANAAANRGAANNAVLAQLGGAALGSYFK